MNLKAKKFFITGIGTNVGKTIVSAILTEYFKADYFKPIQSGNTDSDATQIEKLISNDVSKIHDSIYSFEQTVSPHYASLLNNTVIDISKIQLPNTNNHLIVEGAGGLMVPLNENTLIIDLIKYLQLPVIVVSQNYLGAINHTLMTIELLKMRNIEIAGIVYNGNGFEENAKYINYYCAINQIAHIPQLNIIDKNTISELCKTLQIYL
jgi:dethiobiotin synthetase